MQENKKHVKLVIVESPAKAATINSYLGSDYKVIASKGHVRDLPKSTLGVDIKHDFKAKYINIQGKSALISEMKKEAKGADKVYLATDPDREGEAISWHLATVLGIAPEDIPRIFEKGFTGGNGRGDKRASGIGLYLCREICRRLGHRIAISSVVDEGTTVRIDLAPQSPVDGQFQILQKC